MKAAFPAAPAAAFPRRGLVSAARRKLASVSPLFATTVLTAAVFLLPAPGAQHEAQAFAGQAELSTPSAVHE